MILKHSHFPGEHESIEPTVLYPIIASVFSTFCVLSVAAFLISNRKCCKQRPNKDVETAVLKQRHANEQKRLSNYQFKFPFGDHPSFTSIMQQEENEIAEEVKESYKSISLSINKPIICCPEHKMSYKYNPKTIYSSTESTVQTCKEIPESHENKHDNESPNSFLKDSLESSSILNKSGNEAKESVRNIKTFHVPDRTLLPSILQNRDYQPILLADNRKVSPGSHVTINSNVTGILVSENGEKNNDKSIENIFKKTKEAKENKNFFTSDEIANAGDIKSLFFKKWLTRAGNRDLNELHSESSVKFDGFDISYDDVESILTSISRMDSNRIQRLKDTDFYQNIIANIPPPPVEMMEEDLSVESVDPDKLDKIIFDKTDGQVHKTLSLTHDEIMRSVVGSNDNAIFNALNKHIDNLDSINRNCGNNEEKHLNNTVENKLSNDNAIKKTDNQGNDSAIMTLGRKANAERSQIMHENVEKNQKTKNENDFRMVCQYLERSHIESESLFRVVAQSESLFRVVNNADIAQRKASRITDNSIKNDLSESDITKALESSENERSDFDTDQVVDHTGNFDTNIDETIDCSYTSNISRPCTLDLRSRNTDLTLETSEDQLTNMTKTCISESTIISCSSVTSKTSHLTTWNEIHKNRNSKKENHYKTTKDENRNDIAISKSKITKSKNKLIRERSFNKTLSSSLSTIETILSSDSKYKPKQSGRTCGNKSESSLPSTYLKTNLPSKRKRLLKIKKSDDERSKTGLNKR